MEPHKDVAPHTFPAIKVRDLTKTFGNLYALRGVGLEVPTGNFLSIFGPNGAGKTTLIRIISTLTHASSGTVEIDGLAPAQAAMEIRKKIGVIAHQTFLYENLTAEENLRFYGRLYKVPDFSAKIEKIINDVGLGLRRRDRVSTFSRGMQQRLSIARAMLHDPSLLLLDEPYTGLDQHASEMLTGWLRELRASHRTTLMVTHDLERGVELADQIAILNRGKLVLNVKRAEIEPERFRETYYKYVAEERAAV